MYMYVVTESHQILAVENLVYADIMISPDTYMISATCTNICICLVFVLSEVAIFISLSELEIKIMLFDLHLKNVQSLTLSQVQDLF